MANEMGPLESDPFRSPFRFSLLFNRLTGLMYLFHQIKDSAHRSNLAYKTVQKLEIFSESEYSNDL